jgi:4'-phosphopantetheinyl transferase
VCEGCFGRDASHCRTLGCGSAALCSRPALLTPAPEGCSDPAPARRSEGPSLINRSYRPWVLFGPSRSRHTIVLSTHLAPLGGESIGETWRFQSRPGSRRSRRRREVKYGAGSRRVRTIPSENYQQGAPSILVDFQGRIRSGTETPVPHERVLMINSLPILAVWSSAPAKLELSEDEVHVWRASLSLAPEVLQRLEATLAPDERSRAARFVFPEGRDDFIAARGILRELLGAYLKRPPASLEFRYGLRGKPALQPGDSGLSIRFSLSHSQGLALYAFAHRRELGIDLELIQPDFGGEELAERFFSDHELTELHALPVELRAEGFFACWTRKEAYVKARGDGLQIPLDGFDVSLTPGRPAELHSPDSARWSLRSFQPAPRFLAAVVGEGSGWRVRHFEWAPWKHTRNRVNS